MVAGWVVVAATAVGGSGAVGGGGALGGAGGSGGSGATGATGGTPAGGSGGTGGEVCGPWAPGQAFGTYHLALAVKLGPTNPVLFRGEVEAYIDLDGVHLKLDMQPIDAGDRVTPVGPAISWQSDLLLGTGGEQPLHFPPKTVQVPGAANPITGSDIEGTFELTGTFCGKSDFMCGELGGQITKPIPLDMDGSTFTLETVSSPELHVDCNKTVAGPPPP
jgi:hypothetical protein